ncbi:hypothetical protein GCM10010425_12690 [Streptomyces spororaveus]|uniref:DUF4158 domain-containing protein n=1 Tax=Streptomyces spororaveus TaxID=284039 RepID=A0ABQ3T5Y8_9ACTN|nr:hypothetical protein Sspor_09810 [Streptomyces spororaveus]
MDELVEHWTVLDGELGLVTGKRGGARLGFVSLLKYPTRHGWSPRPRAEFPDEVVEFVARQMKVPTAVFDSCQWSGSRMEYHRAQAREVLGFRMCSVQDAEKLTACLVAARLALDVGDRGLALVPDDWQNEVRDDSDAESVLALFKAMPGQLSLEPMLREIRMLTVTRAIGLPGALIADVAPKVPASWRQGHAVKSLSRPCRRSDEAVVTLLAALLERERAATDSLGGLLIATVQRIGSRAGQKVTNELINAFKRVSGKECLLLAIAEASLCEPDGEVLLPAVRGGGHTLKELGLPLLWSRVRLYGEVRLDLGSRLTIGPVAEGRWLRGGGPPSPGRYRRRRTSRTNAATARRTSARSCEAVPFRAMPVMVTTAVARIASPATSTAADQMSMCQSFRKQPRPPRTRRPRAPSPGPSAVGHGCRIAGFPAASPPGLAARRPSASGSGRIETAPERKLASERGNRYCLGTGCSGGGARVAPGRAAPEREDAEGCGRRGQPASAGSCRPFARCAVAP